MKYSDTLAATVMRRFPDPDTYPYRSWSYSQGFLLWGFIRLYEKTGNEAYREYVLTFCREHVNDSGCISGFTGESLDDILCGSVLVWAFTHTREEKYRLACLVVRAAFDDYPRNVNGGFWHGRRLTGEMWVDGLFMGLMFLTRFGRYIGDTAYCYAETVRQLSAAYACCNKDDSGLLYHAYSERPYTDWANPVTGRSHEVWCEGLGWYAMILCDVLELMPSSQPGYDGILAQLRKLVRALSLCQDGASGLWYQVVDKTRAAQNWHDTSGSAMFLYCIKKAVLLGYVDPLYTKTADAAFAGIKTKYLLDPEGNTNIMDACDGLGVQADYDAYVHFRKNVNAKEAVAAVLWAAAIMEYGV
jgi:unsaturated rhamnogalacturonyl hydrolase